MNAATFYTALAISLAEYFPEEMDESLMPRDSAECAECRNIKFDFIIVGAGSAGCVLANRLTDNPRWKVLLIEAGEDENFITDLPITTALYYTGSKYDWNFTTVQQKHTCASNKGYCKFPRGKLMGGSSSINGMLYVRGNAADFDEWEAMGNPGWSYKDVLPYFLKAENMTIPEFMTSPYHSTKGPQYVGYGRYNSSLVKDLLQAGIELGLTATDYNGEKQYGVSYTQFSVKGSTRCSTSKAYLNPIKGRKNLFIFKNSMVSKVLISQGSKRAVGVRYVSAGVEYNVFARKEVILSAGAINTPKLLMLSGIGPRDHLERLGIQVHSDLPVGQQYFDHNLLFFSYSCDMPELDFSVPGAEEAILEYSKYKRGILSSPSYYLSMFINSSSTQVLDTQLTVQLKTKGFAESFEPGVGFIVTSFFPKSRGTIKLKTSNYLEPPLIDPNSFAVKSDITQLKWGVRKAIEFMNTKVMSKYSPKLIDEFNCSVHDPPNEADLECLVKQTPFTGGHPSGTVKMGPSGDKTAVVDAKLNVYGVYRLRVVDGSVFPRTTSGNPNAPTIMLAEKAADLIKTLYWHRFVK